MQPIAAANADPTSLVSYVVKKAFHLAWWGIGPSGTGTIGKCRKDGDFDYPSDQVLLYERSGWHWGDASKGDMSVTSSAGQTGQGNGAGVTLNMAFMDGHVASKRLPADVGAGEPDYYNFNPNATTSTAQKVSQMTDPHSYIDSLD